MAENGDHPDRRDPNERDNESLPEVEAELVSETAASSDAFEDDAQEDTPSQDADAGDAEEEALKSARPSTLTPGVMLFLGFVVVALIAFGAWRMQGQPDHAPEVAAPEQIEPSVETPAAWSAAAADKPALQIQNAPPEKIENTPIDEMKRAPEHAAEEEAGYLPPVMEGAASKLSNSVEDGAKEAMRRFRESEDAAAVETDGADQGVPSTEQVIGFEIAPAEVAPLEEQYNAPVEDAAAREQELATASHALAAEASIVPVATFEAERAALLGEFTAEKQQLEASLTSERQRADNEAEESARLRIALDEAVQRDQAAQEELAALRLSLETLRNEGSNSDSRQMKATFALAALSRAIDQGGSYTEELVAVEEFEPAAAMLEAHAEAGVASEASLRERYDAAARAGLAAATQEKAGGGFAGVMARAQSMISVRPATPTSGDEPGAILSRADHAMDQGEVAFALLQLEDLPLVAQEAMSDWIADARARAEAQSSLAALTARITGQAD